MSGPEAKHTAGPWEATPRGGVETQWDIQPVAAAGMGWVLLPHQDPAGKGVYMQVGGVISEADARLISAAPDLLEALSELIEANSFYFKPGNPWGDKARAAIAKAAGQ